MQTSTADCSELLEKTTVNLSNDTLLQLFVTVQKNNLSLSIEYAIIRYLCHVWLYEANLLITQNNRFALPAGRLFKRKREWREVVENILQYFPHMVCETNLTIQLYNEMIYFNRK